MKIKKTLLICIIIVSVFLLTGCLPGHARYTASDPAGFFWGIWHGWTAPVSLVVGIFNKSVRVYEVMNTGWWYDFGFYIAIISGFGGLSLTRRKNSDN